MYVLILSILRYKEFIVKILVRIKLKIIKILLIQFSDDSIRNFKIFDIKVIYNIDNCAYIIKEFLLYK